MKVKYFQDTDTLYIEFRAGNIAGTLDLDANTAVDFDADDHICATTMEHAKDRTDVPRFTFEEVAA